MLLSKTFAVPVEPVKKPSSVLTSDQTFFDPGTSTSGLSSGVTVGGAGPVLLRPPVKQPVRVLPALLRVPVLM